MPQDDKNRLRWALNRKRKAAAKKKAATRKAIQKSSRGAVERIGGRSVTVLGNRAIEARQNRPSGTTKDTRPVKRPKPPMSRTSGGRVVGKAPKYR